MDRYYFITDTGVEIEIDFFELQTRLLRELRGADKLLKMRHMLSRLFNDGLLPLKAGALVIRFDDEGYNDAPSDELKFID